MRRFLVTGAAALTLALPLAALGPGAAEACARSSVAGATAAVRPGQRIDQSLADAAIRAEVNFHRCRAGLSPLKEAAGLRRVASRHALWMAKARSLSHKSSTPGQSTTLARIKSSGLKIRAGSENIGHLGSYQFGGGAFRITNASTCGFANSGGAPIPPHSYATLARSIVQLWMDSPAHRRNILDRKVTRVGSGVGFDPRAPHCGNFYVAQDFAG